MKRPLRGLLSMEEIMVESLSGAEIEVLERQMARASVAAVHADARAAAHHHGPAPKGALVYDIRGKEYIDAFASLWTVNVGHGRQEIFDAIKAQMEQLACYHIFQSPTRPRSSSPPRSRSICRPT